MAKLKSRKFWIAVLGSLAPLIGQYLSQEFTLEQALTASSAILISYIFGQAYVDGKTEPALLLGASEADEEAGVSS